MERSIKDFLTKQKRKRILTKAIEDHILKKLGGENYWKKGGYQTLAYSLEALVEKEFIRPIKAWKKNGLSPPLYNGYQILFQESLPEEEKRKLLTSFHPLINTSYYMTHPKEYTYYSPYLKDLDRFLKENKDFHGKAPLTVNQRSFQIFFDEKWLASTEAHSFLSHICLTYQDLNCYPTYEPFFLYHKGDMGDRVKGLIIENKDTFYSFKKLFQEGFSSFNGWDYNLLIYGEGNKITKSFSYYYELEQFFGLPSSFHYFGDLDPAGISIWYRLKERVQNEIIPGVFFYQRLLDYQRERGKALRTNQRPLTQEVKDDFLSFFSADYRKSIQDLLQKRRYIPQEGLHYLHLEELKDVEKGDPRGL